MTNLEFKNRDKMKYEEIKVGDVFICDEEETVISKSDRYRIITTINSEIIPTTWSEEKLHLLKPIKKELPEEGLLVHKDGSLVYKLSDGSGYGFARGRQSDYLFSKSWGFSNVDLWKPATPEQKKKFVEMLKIECENRGLFEDTKLSEYGINNSVNAVNKGIFSVTFTSHEDWNKNGIIFHKGKFATPLEETTLELVSKAVKEIGDFIVEQTESGVIILTPINK